MDFRDELYTKAPNDSKSIQIRKCDSSFYGNWLRKLNLHFPCGTKCCFVI